MQLTSNFNLKEFSCHDKDNTPVPAELIDNVQKLAFQLQILRDYLKTPIIINSGYRTEIYNKEIGGAPKSQHLLGKAADIKTFKYTSEQIHRAIERLIADGTLKDIKGLGLYNSFCHVDIREKYARWDLRK